MPSPKDMEVDDQSEELVALANETSGIVATHMDKLAFSDALAAIWELINKANKYIELEAPWKLSKAGNTDELEAVIYNLCEVLRIVMILITPFMPQTAERAWKQLNFAEPLEAQSVVNIECGKKIAGTVVAKGELLFPRVVQE